MESLPDTINLPRIATVVGHGDAHMPMGLFQEQRTDEQP